MSVGRAVLTAEVRAEILRLRELGYGPVTISRQVGVSKTSVSRLIYPGYLERNRRMSREAKRRRNGKCEVCGGKTSLRRDGQGCSLVCEECAPDFYREFHRAQRLGKGPVVSRILELADGERRLVDIARIIAGEQGRDLDAMQNQVQVQVYDHVGYGTLERVRRGVYRRTEKAPT